MVGTINIVSHAGSLHGRSGSSAYVQLQSGGGREGASVHATEHGPSS